MAIEHAMLWRAPAWLLSGHHTLEWHARAASRTPHIPARKAGELGSDSMRVCLCVAGKGAREVRCVSAFA
jgi:hypothetical protein